MGDVYDDSTSRFDVHRGFSDFDSFVGKEEQLSSANLSSLFEFAGFNSTKFQINDQPSDFFYCSN